MTIQTPAKVLRQRGESGDDIVHEPDGIGKALFGHKVRQGTAWGDRPVDLSNQLRESRRRFIPEPRRERLSGTGGKVGDRGETGPAQAGSGFFPRFERFDRQSGQSMRLAPGLNDPAPAEPGQRPGRARRSGNTDACCKALGFQTGFHISNQFRLSAKQMGHTRNVAHDGIGRLGGNEGSVAIAPVSQLFQ